MTGGLISTHVQTMHFDCMHRQCISISCFFSLPDNKMRDKLKEMNSTAAEFFIISITLILCLPFYGEASNLVA